MGQEKAKNKLPFVGNGIEGEWRELCVIFNGDEPGHGGIRVGPHFTRGVDENRGEVFVVKISIHEGALHLCFGLRLQVVLNFSHNIRRRPDVTSGIGFTIAPHRSKI